MGEYKYKVSVLCTAYNHEQYIKDALDGFVFQETDFPFQVLVNDDCSSDNTAAIIARYAEKYPDIIRPFYQKENLYSQGGMPFLFSTVFYPNAEGEYIALCEGDDYWCDNTKLQQQVDYLDANKDCTACVHNTIVHSFDGNDIEEHLLLPQGKDRDVDFSTIIKGMSHAFHTSSVLARREYIIHPPDFHYVAAEHGFTDYAIALWLALNGRVHFIDKPMSLYRVGSNADAWSANIDKKYSKLKEFIVGEIAMMETMLPRLNEEQEMAARHEILDRKFELAYIEGRVGDMVKPPLDEIYRAKPLGYRFKTRLKLLFPFMHKYYRKKQGYEDY